MFIVKAYYLHYWACKKVNPAYFHDNYFNKAKRPQIKTL